jgi:hypothetical protein
MRIAFSVILAQILILALLHVKCACVEFAAEQVTMAQEKDLYIYNYIVENGVVTFISQEIIRNAVGVGLIESRVRLEENDKGEKVPTLHVGEAKTMLDSFRGQMILVDRNNSACVITKIPMINEVDMKKLIQLGTLPKTIKDRVAP